MSILRERLLRELEDYFTGRGRFDRSEYYGMRGSQVWELLVDYCEQLAPDEQSELTLLLTEVATVDQQQLIPDVPGAVPGAVQVLLSLCIKGHWNQFSQSAALLEREFTDPSNIEMWTHAGEMTESQGGADFKQTWHYAAVLSFILKLLGSERAAITRQYLLEHADSQEFKETLNNQ